MRIRGILFDKDGTLIDFYSVWLTAAERVIPEFLAVNGLPDDKQTVTAVMEAIGVKDGQVDPKGALAYKSYLEIAADVHNALAEEGVDIRLTDEEISAQLITLFNLAVTDKNQEYHTFTDLKLLFGELKREDIHIGLATADTYDSARKCMKRLGVLEYLDYLGADNGRLRPKPETDMLEQFAQKFNIPQTQIAVVGDTENDIRFARGGNAVAIGVLSGVSTEKELKEADYLIDSVDELLPLLRQEEDRCQK